MQLRHYAFAVLIGLCLVGSTQASSLSPSRLRCEYRENPLGIDARQPRLSWIVESEQRDQIQSAYQILVATSQELLAQGRADLWDSGKVSSDQTVCVIYKGEKLRSGLRAFWKVRVWDGQNKPSSFSRPAWWEMGLIEPGDWHAKWIRRKRAPVPEEQMFEDHPAPLLRGEFKLDQPIASARLYVTGLGYYELYLNGQRVGDHVLDPGWTSYSKRVLYSTYDITAQLKGGTNALGLMLGNGWFNPMPLAMWGKIDPRKALTIGEPRAIVQVQVKFTDGTLQYFGTDESWKTSDGPVSRNSVYLGEWYDARKEQPDWNRAGFDDSKWDAAVLAQEPLGPLCAQSAPPIRVTRTLKPVKVTETGPNVYIYDMGQNFAGFVRLRVQGPAGTQVRLRYGELLNKDGTLNGMTAVCGQIKAGGPQYRYPGSGKPKTAFQLDQYTLKGKGEETFTPRFTFHGFRYVEVTGLQSPPIIEGLRLNSDVLTAGSFSCSNEMFNRIQDMVLWTELSNLFSVQSDCPHREKFGYGGDIVASSEMGMLNFGMETFYEKAVQDLADAVRPNGGFTETAPFVGISDQGLGEQSGPIGWGTAHPLLVWQLYQYYGNVKLLEEQYPAVQRWISLLQANAKDGILDNGLSDHESLVPKPRALTGTAFYYFNVQLCARIARALGREDEANKAELLANRIAAAFNQAFLKKDGQYDIGTQAAQAFPLYMGLTPKEVEDPALGFLLRDISDKGQHLTTGIFGTKFLLNTLSDRGRGGVAYAIVNQRTFPGWGHMLENGATTLWEHWGFSDNTYSHNHPMFGSVSEWFYKTIGGISPATNAVAFNQIMVRPQPLGDLKWAKTSYDSVRGRIATEWKKEAGQFSLAVRVPANTSATVYVATSDPQSVREGGQTLEKSGISTQLEKGYVVCFVGSGTYRFSSALR